LSRRAARKKSAAWTMARYKGAKPATARGSEPVSQSTSFGGTVDLKANPNPAEIQPTAIVAAPNGKGVG
jgi:hypothetical protein